MKSVSSRNLVLGIIIYFGLGFATFIILNALPERLSLSGDTISDVTFKARYVLLGLISFGISFLGWILWETFARKLFINNTFNARFNMTKIWWFYTLVLLVITFFLSVPIYRLISFAGNLGLSIFSLMFYPISAIIAFWVTSAACSPSPFKYAVPGSVGIRSFFDKFMPTRHQRSESL